MGKIQKLPCFLKKSCHKAEWHRRKSA